MDRDESEARDEQWWSNRQAALRHAETDREAGDTTVSRFGLDAHPVVFPIDPADGAWSALDPDGLFDDLARVIRRPRGFHRTRQNDPANGLAGRIGLRHVRTPRCLPPFNPHRHGHDGRRRHVHRHVGRFEITGHRPGVGRWQTRRVPPPTHALGNRGRSGRPGPPARRRA